MAAAKKKAPTPLAKAPEAGSDLKAAAFADLRSILAKYVKKADVKHDTPTYLYLDSKKPYNGKPLFFAATGIKKSYVSFYFFPIYMFPDLGNGMSAELKKRRQGKSCFNFQAPDKVLFEELADLTKRGYDRFVAEDLL